MELSFKEASVTYWTYRAGQDGTMNIGQVCDVIIPIADRKGVKVSELIDASEARVGAWLAKFAS